MFRHAHCKIKKSTINRNPRNNCI